MARAPLTLPFFSHQDGFLAFDREARHATTITRLFRVSLPRPDYYARLPSWVGPGGSKPYRFHGFEPSVAYVTKALGPL